MKLHADFGMFNHGWYSFTLLSMVQQALILGSYCNLVIFHVENISYVIISYSFNFVRSPYRIRNTCENFVVEKYSYVLFSYGQQRTKLNRVRNKTKLRYLIAIGIEEKYPSNGSWAWPLDICDRIWENRPLCYKTICSVRAKSVAKVTKSGLHNIHATM